MTEKILIAASTYGHIKRFHMPYIEAMRAAGHNVVTLAESGSCADLTVPFVKSLFSPHNLIALLRLRKILRSEHFDRVILHTALSSFLVRLAVKMLPKHRRPFVVNTVHGYLFSDARGFKNRLYLFLERILRSVTDRVLVMNREDLAIAEGYRLGREIRMTRGMGLPMCDVMSDGMSVRRVLPIADGDRILLFVGELSKRKNQSFLIDTMSMLPANVHLVLVGDGTEREALCRRSLAAGLTDCVYAYLAAADIYVSAAKSEGLPFNVMEAMAFGLPIVASDVKGQRDLLGDSEAVLYPLGDTRAFLSGVSRMAEHPHRLVYPALEKYRLEAVFAETLGGFLDKKEETP